jgi:hypothetical protein
MKWVIGISVLAVTMGWAAMATIPVAAVSVDEASLRFVPPDTQGIVSIDVAALRTAPLVQDMLKQQLTAPKGWDDAIAKAGVNPQQDIDRVTIAKLSAQDGLVIVLGRIDKFKVEQVLKDSGKVTDSYLGQTIYREAENGIVVLDNVVLLGQMNAVKKAIDQMQLPGAQPLRSDLAAAIQTIEAGNQIWGVGDFSATDLGLVGVRGPAPVIEMLKTLKNGTGQMRIDTGIHARGTATFADAESAKNLSDLARGALAIAKLQIAKQQPDMLQVLDGVQVSSSGNVLTLRVEESGDLLKKLSTTRLRAAIGK